MRALRRDPAWPRTPAQRLALVERTRRVLTDAANHLWQGSENYRSISGNPEYSIDRAWGMPFVEDFFAYYRKLVGDSRYDCICRAADMAIGKNSFDWRAWGEGKTLLDGFPWSDEGYRSRLEVLEEVWRKRTGLPPKETPDLPAGGAPGVKSEC
ncbi:MAG: hypothetical protein ACREVL_01140 [Solimonas sp.]